MANITKNALAASLRKILEQKPLDKITIKDIVDDCGVNRQTFYYHFHDIYDIIGWIFEEQLKTANLNEYTNLSDAYADLTDYFISNKKLIDNIYYSINRTDLEKHIKQMLKPLIYQTISEQGKTFALAADDIDFIVSAYCSILISGILNWIENNMETKPLPQMEKFLRLMEKSTQAVLKGYSEA